MFVNFHKNLFTFGVNNKSVHHFGEVEIYLYWNLLIHEHGISTYSLSLFSPQCSITFLCRDLDQLFVKHIPIYFIFCL